MPERAAGEAYTRNVAQVERRSRRGRIIGSVAAGLLLVVGVTSFVIPILVAACILAVVAAYIGGRYDQRRGDHRPPSP